MLETSVCVALIRGRAAEAHLPDASECVLSVITVAELEVGVRRSVRPAAQRKAVEAFTGIFEVLPWDLQTTSYYGDLRVDLEKRGLVIGPLDMLIAAHALRLGATLVTANFREFQRVANLPCVEWK
ncbi:MAG: type II toxin-antitoxin system VapC family toxin [Thermoanaerobaculia bacterium]